MYSCVCIYIYIYIYTKIKKQKTRCATVNKTHFQFSQIFWLFYITFYSVCE